MKILDYRLIRETGEDKFEAEIGAAIKEGWQPYGNPFYAPPDNEDQYGWFYQAVIRMQDADEIIETLDAIVDRLSDIADRIDKKAI